MYDCIIIGSGPAGLSAAIYAVRGGMDILVLESAAMSGGQVLNTYEVDNYLGLPGMDGFEMGTTFRKHADKLGVNFKTAQVMAVEDAGDKKIVRTKKEELETKTVILAMGAKHALLGAKGEAEYTGKGVSYCATCDGAFYRGRIAAVVGGGDVALEDAIYLAKLCKKVYLIHRRNEFRGAKILQDEVLSMPNIEILYSCTVEEIYGSDMVEGILVKDKNTGVSQRIEVDALFVAVGLVPNSGIVKNLPILNDADYVIAGEDGMTNVSGIFVAGDIRKKPLKQIITAASDGANAANSAIDYVNMKRRTII